MWNRKQDGGELMGQGILSDPENQATIEELKVNLIKRQGIIPFVGAGLSAPWFPVWRNFLLESVLAGAARDEVESILASDRVGRFEIAAGAVERILGREAFDRHIYQTFGTALARDALISDNAVSQLTDLPTGPVITTNYDHVLETVFRMHRKAFDMVLWGARIQLGIDSLMEDQAVLLKLHGDARHPEDRVLTDAEYERHYGPIGVSSFDQWEGTRLLPLILARLFRSRPVLFLGCSLEEDRTLLILKRCAQQRPDIPHFAVVPRPNSAGEQKARQNFLETHGIYPIWFSAGQYGQISVLLDHLIATLPPGISQNPASQASLRRNAEADLDRSEARRNTIQKHWLALSTPADRLEFYRDHEYEILRNWPGDLLSMASIVQSEQINLDPEESISALIGRATAASAIGDRGLAEMLEKELADHFRETEPDANYVDFLHGISHQLRLREPVAAEPRSRMAIRLARRLGLGSPSMWWRMWATRASILGKLGKTRLSRHYLVRALRLARKTWQEQRNPASAADIADILVMVMDIHSSRGEAKKAEATGRLALRWVEPGDYRIAAVIHNNIGLALQLTEEELDGVRALEEHRNALWCAQQAGGDLKRLHAGHMNLAWLHWSRACTAKLGSEAYTASMHRAQGHFDQALVFAEADEDEFNRAGVLAQRALVLSELGRRTEAISDLDKAETTVRRFQDFGLLAMVLNNRGVILSADPSSRGAARASYKEAMEVARKVGDIPIQRTIEANLAELDEVD